MKDTITNKINSFTATLLVADDPRFVGIWTGQAPAGFGLGLAALRPQLTELITKGARQSAPASGDAGALKTLRTDFETYLHRLARATFRALTRLGRPEDAATVDLTPSELARARARILAGLGETVLELAEPLSVAPPGGGARPGEPEGIVPAVVAKVDDLWQRYSAAVGAPFTARSKRKALTGQLPDDVRALEGAFAALDDLVIQFDETPAGAEFVDSWFNARQVVDLGRRAAKPAPKPASQPTPPPPKP